MSGEEVETIEVPVTRRARVTRLGRLLMSGAWWAVEWSGAERLKPGDEVACKGLLGWWRAGTVRVQENGYVEFGSIGAACDGDTVYRVEPPP